MAIRNQVTKMNETETNTKVCISCNLTKSLDEYQTRKRGNKTEYLGRCRECERNRINEWRQSKSTEKKKDKLEKLGITEEIKENQKYCTKCLKVKNLNEFGTYKKDTKEYYFSGCKECYKLEARKKRISQGVIPRITRKCRYCKMTFNKDYINDKYVCQDCVERNKNDIEEGYKRCCCCENIKKLEEFPNRTLPSGKMGKKSNCTICTKLVEYPKGRIIKALQRKNVKKSTNTVDLIGCSYAELEKWLEYQFTAEMNWENMGSYWHMDHVTPCSLFELDIEKEQFKCFNWRNLRPLEAKKNITKSDKIVVMDILHQELKVKYYEKNFS